MTSVGHAPRPHEAKRNWGGVLLVITAAALLVLTFLEDLRVALPDGFSAPATLLVELATYVLSPIALVAAVVPLAFGTRRLDALPGHSRAGRVLLIGWGVFTACTQFGILLVLRAPFGVADVAEQLRQVFEVIAVLLGLGAAVFVARAHIAARLGRISLFIAVALFGVSAVLLATGSFGYFSFSDGPNIPNVPVLLTLFSWDLPGLLGLLILGISWWRVGAQGSRVPNAPKSLAE